MEWIRDIKPLTDLLNGLLSPILAATVVYIAFQQWKTNDSREKRESRSAKISIYKSVKSHLHHIDATREIRIELYENFRQAHAEADFVFPKELTEYLDDIDIYSSQWISDKECLDSAAQDADMKSIIKLEADMEKYIDSLQDAHCVLYDNFSKYINVI